MPFDNPHEMPFGDIEILRNARARISHRRDWVQGCFRDGDRHCLVAALSLASDSRSFRRSNPTERRLARCSPASFQGPRRSGRGRALSLPGSA